MCYKEGNVFRPLSVFKVKQQLYKSHLLLQDKIAY